MLGNQVKKTCLYLMSTTDPSPLPSLCPQKKRRNGNAIIKVLKWKTMTNTTIKPIRAFAFNLVNAIC